MFDQADEAKNMAESFSKSGTARAAISTGSGIVLD
jgi:hypothetical protein